MNRTKHVPYLEVSVAILLTLPGYPDASPPVGNSVAELVYAANRMCKSITPPASTWCVSLMYHPTEHKLTSPPNCGTMLTDYQVPYPYLLTWLSRGVL